MKDDSVEPPEPTAEEEIKYLREQLADSQKQVALSIEELATTYFVKQMADMKEYIESIRKSFQTDEQKFDALALQLMNWSSIYVHGANLASTKLMLDQSQNQVTMLMDFLKRVDDEVLVPVAMKLEVKKETLNKLLPLSAQILNSTTPPPYVHVDELKQSRIKAMEGCLEVAHKLGPDEWSCAVVEAICSLIAQEKGGDVK